MPPEAPPPGPSPRWYRRLPPALRRVAEKSDRVPRLALTPTPALRAAVAALPAALDAGRATEVRALSQAIADGICGALRVPRVHIRVELRRPPLRGGEL